MTDVVFMRNIGSPQEQNWTVLTDKTIPFSFLHKFGTASLRCRRIVEGVPVDVSHTRNPHLATVETVSIDPVGRTLKPDGENNYKFLIRGRQYKIIHQRT